MKTNDIVVFCVSTGENPEEKKDHAWGEYLAKGGRQEKDKTLFVRINEIRKC
ncbi:MAG: hypothetical protein JSR46_09935 [Verrucomicrobia bacterium]|nr:hypothetical protein [Verrucomicrobiota bacterium]